jgi:acetyltransferase-like isoleucine patch superfamily enzyme
MSNITLGRHSYNNGICKGSANKVIVGNFTSIGECIFDCGFNHNTSFVSTFPFRTLMTGCENVESNIRVNGSINIGSDVWIGDKSIIMSGVTIGDGAIIGGNAVITNNVDAYSMVGGVPARHIKYRYDRKTIDKLLRIAWWNFPDEEIVKIAPLVSSDRIEEFLKMYE